MHNGLHFYAGLFLFSYKIWLKTPTPLFLHTSQIAKSGLVHGVTVALQFLVLSVKVRILMNQQSGS